MNAFSLFGFVGSFNIYLLFIITLVLTNKMEGIINLEDIFDEDCENQTLHYSIGEVTL